MFASRKRATPPPLRSHSSTSSDNMLLDNINDAIGESEHALDLVNQTIEDMTNQLRDINRKKPKRFFGQTSREEINVHGMTLYVCTDDSFSSGMRSPIAGTPVAGTPRNASTLFATQQAQARLANLQRLAHVGVTQINALSEEFNDLALTDPTPPNSPFSNR